MISLKPMKLKPSQLSIEQINTYINQLNTMIQFEKELITPSKAKTYLEANTNNRNVKDRHVLKLSNEMKSGRWKQDTAETIKISKTGRILDGQHRLMAVIQSGVSIYFHVAKGLNEEVFDVIDTGSNRSAADVFKINHAKYESILPSIIQTSKIISRGKRDSRQSFSYTYILESLQEMASVCGKRYVKCLRRSSRASSDIAPTCS